MPADPSELARLRSMMAEVPAEGNAAADADAAVEASEGARGAREAPVHQITDADEDVRKAAAFILRSTGSRPQTESEIRAKLVAREYPPETIDAALAHARRVGAIDDHALARALVDDRGTGSGWGHARIAQELERRGVPEHLAASALSALDERDDLAVATELARDRLRQMSASLQPETVARRLIGYLTRRGHPPGLAQRVAREVSGLDRQWD